MAVDIGRSSHKTMMRFFADPSVPPTLVRWYKTDQPFIRFPTFTMNEDFQTEGDYPDQLGEVWDAPRPWANGAPQLPPPWPIDTFQGTEEQWSHDGGLPVAWVGIGRWMRRVGLGMAFSTNQPITGVDLIGLSMTFRTNNPIVPMEFRTLLHAESSFIGRSLMLIQVSRRVGLEMDFAAAASFALDLVKTNRVKLSPSGIVMLACGLANIYGVHETSMSVASFAVHLAELMGLTETAHGKGTVSQVLQRIISEAHLYTATALFGGGAGQPEKYSVGISTYQLVTLAAGKTLRQPCFANLSGGTGTCTCMNGIKVALNWSAAHGDMEGNFTGCSAGTSTVKVFLSGSTYKCQLTGGLTMVSTSMTGADGANPTLTCTNTVTGGCAGSVTVTLSAT